MGAFTNQDLVQLKKSFPDLKFKTNVPLSKLAYFKIGGPAEVLVKLDNREKLVELIRYSRSQDFPVNVLGGLSNVIISDEGIKGLVILARHSQIDVIDQDQNGAVVQVDAGLRTSLLVNKTVELGLAGLEPFLGVPGRVGGAVYNNAHFQDELIGTYVDQVEVLGVDNEVVWLDQDACQFSYNFSRFQTSDEIILRVKFKLTSSNANFSRQKMRQTTLYRIKTQPLGLPSSGCIFKNPANNDFLKQRFPQFKDKQYISAGFLIDRAGLKGQKQGDIQVSQEHAAFMVNLGKGTAQDVKKLIAQVKQQVNKKFQVELEEEVFWLGE